ncbi:Serine/threonine-protein kinase PRP4 [Perkinsus chesapeaki]|uniref:Cap-specific mRNA (nucleoside-2'-O-)-methyltransferase n=1 Tax=Perkinsus chesapeaki TaxID=330153 RepID=A0A7J6MKC6_PERCH|nr:Serine/threonine-protein kinase PRP4 [Perkinsus chesapeaki]
MTTDITMETILDHLLVAMIIIVVAHETMTTLADVETMKVRCARIGVIGAEDIEMDDKLVDALESSMEAMDANSDAAIQKRREERRKLQRKLTEQEMARKRERDASVKPSIGGSVSVASGKESIMLCAAPSPDDDESDKGMMSVSDLSSPSAAAHPPEHESPSSSDETPQREEKPSTANAALPSGLEALKAKMAATQAKALAEIRRLKEAADETMRRKAAETANALVSDEKAQVTDAEINIMLKRAKEIYDERVKQRDLGVQEEDGQNDDKEGYFVPGHLETMDGRYVVLTSSDSDVGKGVFSNVVKCKDTQTLQDVAIKVIRRNDMMRKAAEKEVRILTKLNDSADEMMTKDKSGRDRSHIVRLLRTFTYQGHLCLVFESLWSNLREAMKKYARPGERGLNPKAVWSYSRQLLLALKHMKSCKIIHADIKPDNILISKNHGHLKICDLGSACEIHEAQEVVEYLVSRFYRAPEIMLGYHKYDYAIDMWAIGCTLFELWTGKILFQGRNNNDMLKQIQDAKGKFPHKQIRASKFVEMRHHFNEQCDFLWQQKGGGVKVITTFTPGSDSLKARILHSTRKLSDSDPNKRWFENKTKQFIDLVDQMTNLNPKHRITPEEALAHPFIVEPFERSEGRALKQVIMGRRSSEGATKRPMASGGDTQQSSSSSSSSSTNLMFKSASRSSWEEDFVEAAQHTRDCVQGNPHCLQRLKDPLCRYLDSPAGGKQLHTEFRRGIDLSKRRVYHRREHEEKSTLHWGQRKLLLAELEFLMTYASNKAAAVVVYVGAGPGDHIPLLIRLINAYRHHNDMSPLSFELYDTTPFVETLRKMAEEDPGTLRLFQEKFNLDRANSHRYKDSTTPVLLMSDIRSGNWQGQTFQQNEKMVMADMSSQLDWWKAMRPQKALMKFRLPYTEGKVRYASGSVNYPIWGAQTTTEARLTIETPDAPIIEYDNQEFGEAMAYFNTVLRTAVYDRPPHLKGPDQPLLDAGLCRCYDCTAEVRILSAYLEGCGADGSDAETVADFSIQISDQMGMRTLLTCIRNPAEKGVTKSKRTEQDSPKRKKVVVAEAVEEEDPTLALMRSMGLPTGFVGDKMAQYDEQANSSDDSSDAASSETEESDEPW